MLSSYQHHRWHNNLSLSHSRRFKFSLNLSRRSKFSNNCRLPTHSKTQHSISSNQRLLCSFTPNQGEGNLSSSQFFSEHKILFFIIISLSFVSDALLFIHLVHLYIFITFCILRYLPNYIHFYPMQTPLNKGRDILPDIFIILWPVPFGTNIFSVLHLKCSTHFIFLIRFSNQMLRPSIFSILFSDRISLLFSVYKLLFWI